MPAYGEEGSIRSSSGPLEVVENPEVFIDQPDESKPHGLHTPKLSFRITLSAQVDCFRLRRDSGT